MYFRPVVVFSDPFRGSPNIFVLSECWNADKTPYKFNYRHGAAELTKKHAEREPLVGLDQDYTLVVLDDRSSPATGLAPGSPWPHYCGVGAGKVVLRDIASLTTRPVYMQASRSPVPTPRLCLAGGITKSAVARASRVSDNVVLFL